MGKMKKLAALLGGTAAAATFAVTYYAYCDSFRGGKKVQADVREIPNAPGFNRYREEMLANIERVLEAPYQTVTIRSCDGLRLTGKFYKGQPGAPLILFFHGYRSTAERDGSGGFQLCREKGWNLLMVDQRAHGESEGKVITFGVKERYDCLAWAEYAAKRFGPETPIFLWGISMGASTVLMSSSLDLPANVRGIVADCGFDTTRGVLLASLRQRHWPEFPLCDMAMLSGMLFGRFWPEETSALECVRKAKLPILLIHGEADSVVPCEMVYRLKEACASPATLLTVPGANHGISWYVNMPAYREMLERFIEENMA